MPAVTVYKSDFLFTPPKDAATWQQIEAFTPLDLAQFDEQMASIRQDLIYTFPYGYGNVFHGMSEEYIATFAEAAAIPEVWGKGIVDSRTAACGLAKAILFEENQRLETAEILHEVDLPRSTSRKGPLTLYEELYNRRPPAVYATSHQQRTVISQLNTWIDPIIASRQLDNCPELREVMDPDEAAALDMSLSVVARPLLRRLGLQQQLQAELELYRISIGLLSENKAPAFRWSLNYLYK